MASPDKATDQSGGEQRSAAPSISLPKGGGAIRGMGEKFAANPVTGTGSMSVPIATSPGRSGFGPQLSLSYDSGSGNGPFGFGWSLSLPAITRQTDKGLPQYRDGEESDVFVLSGAEDLVPVLIDKDGGKWEREQTPPRTVNGKTYRIQRYHPRIEGLFARIERWTNAADPRDTFWRSISKDNITTWYGRSAENRIANPADPTRIFSWLICESYDDKGNAIVYEYAAENDNNVDRGQANERNRVRTANRYLKRIKYGNCTPNRDATTWHTIDTAPLPNDTWMFGVVFDYGEHDQDKPMSVEPGTSWPRRNDPFSTYRAGFEVRTYRLCQRVLMFHHIPDLPTGGKGYDGLVRSTDFTYAYEEDPTNARNPVYSLLNSVTQTGYKRKAGGGYFNKSMPSLEFEYTLPVVQDTVEEVDGESLENLPMGLDGNTYQWTDLHGEGISGILTEQAGAWFYKRNVSPIGKHPVEFAPMERVAIKPNLALVGGVQFMDLAGDGLPDLVVRDGPMPGLYEHDEEEGWQSFRPFTSRLNRDFRDPNLRFVDLDGDGHADVLITEDDAFVWHASLAEEGFGPARCVARALDEEKGPRIVFAESTQSIYLADLSGDGLTDIVRIRNGEVCYWPNLGYGRFGAKVTMDNAPRFDHPDQFDHRRIRLADIDGSGTTDIIYLHRDGVRLYFNQSGNSWSRRHTLKAFPRIDDLASIMPIDLLGNGTACLVWSSPLPGDAQRQMRYVDLMGGQKPHLLIRTVNNLGAETRIKYVPSTKFYLQDKQDGKPWITRLPFPVHVVERVETHDYISRNRFVSRYAYHHGYFDGEEREFRGFGMVEQWDTEELGALTAGGTLPAAVNIDKASHVPPVRTRTWFHTGVYVDREKVSRQFEQEYFREPGLTIETARPLLLDDTVLPDSLTSEEEREACRALKGSMLRQEVYALDGTDKEKYPYTVTEQNFTIRRLQPRDGNRHAVFFTYAREAISYHHERNPADPRVHHALTLEVDAFGNVLTSLSVGYGRRPGQSPLKGEDRKKQEQTLITYTENRVTNPLDIGCADDYRTPLPAETCIYELTGFKPENNASRFSFDEWARNGFALAASAAEIPYEQMSDNVFKQKRLIEHVRTFYRKNNLTALLPLGGLESLALAGESYKLAFTPGLAKQLYVESCKLSPADLDSVLADSKYIHSEGDGNWWVPSGRLFLSPDNDTAAQELGYARQHFFLPHRYRDPFHTDQFNAETVVAYDDHKLLLTETRDALDNTVRAENDYRVLAPHRMTDPNGNRSEVAFDALGLAVAAAIKGKEGQSLGDLLEDFDPDPPLAELQGFVANPQGQAASLLGKATTRVVYDLDRFRQSGEPPFAATLARETHVGDIGQNQQTKIQIGTTYSDGFGREIQKKIQAEPGPAPQRDAGGKIIVGADGQPVMTANDVSPRWVGSGWTVFNNKGKPVRQYEPFFTDTHRFEFEVKIGASPVLFYDPVERVVATLHPNHTYEKVVFDPWRQTTYDVNDTCAPHNAQSGDPRTDLHIKGYVAEYFKIQSNTWQTWHQQRITGAKGSEEQKAAEKAAKHSSTPSVVHFDTLGRPFLTIADNGDKGKYSTCVELDIEGNQREVIDAKDGVVMRYDYDMLGNRIYQASMEAGERWMLNDVAGKPIRAWDSRGHSFRTAYDRLRRPTDSFMEKDVGTEVLIGRTIYGETRSSPEADNLRGKVVQLFDQAGVVTTDKYDFKGNPLRSSRRLAVDYKNALDWSGAVPLENGDYTSRTRYDALNRPTELTAPDNSVIRPAYNEANLLEWVDANLRGAATATPFVTDIDYDAKGQRTLIDYGNGTRTTYTYDPLTYRLSNLRSTRGGIALQDLSYTYDPAGNITFIRDGGQQAIFFNNAVVEPHADYTYDAIYRLIEATGREHIGQLSQPQTTWDDQPRVHLQHPHDGQAMRSYKERYQYDEVGNFLNLIHQANNGDWTRGYTYQEASQIEPATVSNRLSGTAVGSAAESYAYDVHGNMLNLPHLPTMQWDFHDQLQQVDLGGGGRAYYVYDAAGQRVRKVIERQNGTRQKERTYLAGSEVYREYDGAGTAVSLQRETLHIMDDKQRIALVETKTLDAASPLTPPASLIRYQLGNHLGSASLELDDAGQIISYEEYHPYGTTSYQAVRSDIEASPKRYRYTGKERDEESGFTYHGARYYAPWLGRWMSCDPIGLVDGLNFYHYVSGNPLQLVDPSGNQETTPDEEKYGQSMTSSNPMTNSKAVLTGQTCEMPYAYTAAIPSSTTHRVSHAPNTGGSGGASGTGEDVGVGGTYGVTPTPRNEYGGYSIDLSPLELKLHREGPKSLEEAFALGGRLALEGEILVLAGEYRIAAMLVGGGLMMSENPTDFSMGASLFVAGAFSSARLKPKGVGAKPTAVSESASPLGKANRVSAAAVSETSEVLPTSAKALQSEGFVLVRHGGGRVGPNSGFRRYDQPAVTGADRMHGYGPGVGGRDPSTILGSPRMNRSYMARWEQEASTAYEQGYGGEWQYEFWARHGEMPSRMAFRWRPDSVKKGWSLDLWGDPMVNPSITGAQLDRSVLWFLMP